MAEPLRIVLGTHGIGERLRSGEVEDPELFLEFPSVTPIHRAFAPMVRDAAWDVCELAVVTALQAVAFDRPVVVLPAVVAARRQRGCLVTLPERALSDPSELAGKRVGVRSYTQTTGMWVRRHLAEDVGLQADQVTWVTQEGAHVEEYADPAHVRRELEGSVLEALKAGEVDAAVLGNDLPPGLTPVLPDASARDEAWVREHGYVPVNHLVVASRAAVEERPDEVRACYELIRRAGADQSGALFGPDALSGPLEEIIAACVAQGLLEDTITAADVLAPARDLLATT